MKTQIRLIQPRDNKTMEQIIVSAFKEFGAETEGVSLKDPEMSDICSTYSGKGSKYWVLVDLEEDRVLGGGGYTKLKGTTEDEKICEVQKFFLIPEVRGKGFGGKIMALIIESAINDGYQEIYLEILESMKQAGKLYEKFGLKYLNKRKGGTGHYSCKIFMGCKLVQQVATHEISKQISE